MQQQKRSNISVVIPCYNEQDQIGLCLEALTSSGVRPLEIIVVDNNSTDSTVKVAGSYPGVKIVQEPTQGLVAARNRGMAIAKGEIIARIDADSLVTPTWLATIQEVFSNPEVQAATGTGFFYDAPLKRIIRAYRNVFAVWLNRVVLGHHMLWGSNMAIRRDAWQALSGKLCTQADIMEDLDIAAHIYKHYGSKALVYRHDMQADISARRAMVSLKRNWLYLKMWPYTLSLHGYRRRIMLWPAIAVLLASMALSSKLARFYNHSENRFIFSLEQWRSNPFYSRGNP